MSLPISNSAPEQTSQQKVTLTEWVCNYPKDPPPPTLTTVCHRRNKMKGLTKLKLIAANVQGISGKIKSLKASSHIRRHDTTACDTTRFFAPHTIKWINSHICSTTKSGRHDKKLRQQKSLWKRFLSFVVATVSRKLL